MGTNLMFLQGELLNMFDQLREGSEDPQTVLHQESDHTCVIFIVFFY